MRVDHGGAQVGMTEEILHFPDGEAVFQQFAGVGMPQGVRVDVLIGDAGSLGLTLDHGADIPVDQWGPLERAEDGPGFLPLGPGFFEHLCADGLPGLDRIDQPWFYRNSSVFIPFSPFNTDLTAPAVDVLGFKADDLGDTEPGPIHNRHHHIVPEPCRVAAVRLGKQSPGFITVQNLGQLVSTTWHGKSPQRSCVHADATQGYHG